MGHPNAYGNVVEFCVSLGDGGPRSVPIGGSVGPGFVGSVAARLYCPVGRQQWCGSASVVW